MILTWWSAKVLEADFCWHWAFFAAATTRTGSLVSLDLLPLVISGVSARYFWEWALRVAEITWESCWAFVCFCSLFSRSVSAASLLGWRSRLVLAVEEDEVGVWDGVGEAVAAAAAAAVVTGERARWTRFAIARRTLGRCLPWARCVLAELLEPCCCGGFSDDDDDDDSFTGCSTSPPVPDSFWCDLERSSTLLPTCLLPAWSRCCCCCWRDFPNRSQLGVGNICRPLFSLFIYALLLLLLLLFRCWCCRVALLAFLLCSCLLACTLFVCLALFCSLLYLANLFRTSQLSNDTQFFGFILFQAAREEVLPRVAPTSAWEHERCNARVFATLFVFICDANKTLSFFSSFSLFQSLYFSLARFLFLSKFRSVNSELLILLLLAQINCPSDQHLLYLAEGPIFYSYRLNLYFNRRSILCSLFSTRELMSR